MQGLKSGALRVRQRPGEKNALGGVKFVLPNTMDIYLHSTSAQQLFAQSRRDFSHGCIRVEDPAALAAFVLRDQPAWTPERIRNAMAAGKESTVMLTQPIPVLIFYTTAIVEADGKVRFASDIYGLDARLTRRCARDRSSLEETAEPSQGEGKQGDADHEQPRETAARPRSSQRLPVTGYFLVLSAAGSFRASSRALVTISGSRTAAIARKIARPQRALPMRDPQFRPPAAPSMARTSATVSCNSRSGCPARSGCARTRQWVIALCPPRRETPPALCPAAA